MILAANPEFVKALLDGEKDYQYGYDSDEESLFNVVFIDFQALRYGDIHDLLESAWSRLNENGNLIIYENQKRNLWRKFVLKRKIRNAISNSINPAEFDCQEVISIPDLYNPICLLSKEDHNLYSFIFGQFLTSYYSSKRKFFKILLALSKRNLKSIIDKLFVSVFIVQKRIYDPAT